MAKTDYSDTVGALGLSHASTGKFSRIQIDVDFEKENLAASYVAKLLKIPADTLVKDVTLKVHRAEGDAATGTLGDYLEATDAAVNADGYGAAIDLNATGVTTCLPGASAPEYAASEGRYYTAASYIGLASTIALDYARVTVTALVCDMSSEKWD